MTIRIRLEAVGGGEYFIQLIIHEYHTFNGFSSYTLCYLCAKEWKRKKCALINTSEEAANFFLFGFIFRIPVWHMLRPRIPYVILYLKIIYVVPVVWRSSKNHSASRKEVGGKKKMPTYGICTDVTLSPGTMNVNCEQFFFFIWIWGFFLFFGSAVM